MWLGHSIEHLVCIGGELETNKALPSPAMKSRALGVLCSRARGRYRQLIGPGSCHEPGLKGGLWSRFTPPTGTNEVPIYTPRSRAEHPSALFFSDRGGVGLVVL